MTYEIEKRSLFKSKSDFIKCREKIAKQSKYLKKYVFKTFLFREPKYLRIRITKGNPKIMITRKIGNHKDTIREEINTLIKPSELKPLLEKLNQEGFKKCVSVKTVSYAYKFDDLRIDFNSITSLGNIVEIEALTRNKKEIPIMEAKIIETMKKFDLKELNPKKYQKMINEIYDEEIKPVIKQKFYI